MSDKAFIDKWTSDIQSSHLRARYDTPLSKKHARAIAKAVSKATDAIHASGRTEGWFNNAIDHALKELVMPAMTAAGIEVERVVSFNENEINPAGYRRYTFAPLFFVDRGDSNYTTICWDNEKGEMVIDSPVDWLSTYEANHFDDFHTWYGRIDVTGDMGDSFDVELDGNTAQWGIVVTELLEDDSITIPPSRRVQFRYGSARIDDAGEVESWTMNFPMTVDEMRALIYAFPDNWTDIAYMGQSDTPGSGRGAVAREPAFRANLKRAKERWVADGKGFFNDLDGLSAAPAPAIPFVGTKRICLQIGVVPIDARNEKVLKNSAGMLANDLRYAGANVTFRGTAPELPRAPDGVREMTPAYFESLYADAGTACLKIVVSEHVPPSADLSADMADADVLGVAYPTLRTAIIGFDANYQQMLITTHHEIGHLLGLEHCDTPKCTMYFKAGERRPGLCNQCLSLLPPGSAFLDGLAGLGAAPPNPERDSVGRWLIRSMDELYYYLRMDSEAIATHQAIGRRSSILFVEPILNAILEGADGQVIELCTVTEDYRHFTVAAAPDTLPVHSGLLQAVQYEVMSGVVTHFGSRFYGDRLITEYVMSHLRTVVDAYGYPRALELLAGATWEDPAAVREVERALASNGLGAKPEKSAAERGAEIKKRRFYCQQLYVWGGYDSRGGTTAIELRVRGSDEVIWEIRDRDDDKNSEWVEPTFGEDEDDEETYGKPITDDGALDEDWFKDEYGNWVGPSGPEYYPPTQVHEFFENDVEPWLDKRYKNKPRKRWPLTFDDRWYTRDGRKECQALDPEGASLIMEYLVAPDGGGEWTVLKDLCEDFDSDEWARATAEALLARLDELWARHGIARRRFRHSGSTRDDRQDRYPLWDNALYEWVFTVLGDDANGARPPRGLSPDFVREATRLMHEVAGFATSLSESMTPEGEDPDENLPDLVARHLLDLMGWSPF